MNVGGVCSGIGGLELGLERAGMTIRWMAETDPYASRVLAKHWPQVPNLGDITKVAWSDVEPVDLLCGGYPCQPFSLAGARRGEHDERHLWPHVAAAVRVLRPRLVLLENVPGHLSLGFGRVLGDLAECGYDAEWACVPAAAVGAPHLRYRVFVVAYPDCEGQSGVTVDAFARPRFLVSDAHLNELRDEPVTLTGSGGTPVVGDDGTDGCVADTDGATWGEPGAASEAVLRPSAIERPGRRGSGSGGGWAAEPDVGRVAHGVPARVDRLRTLGNAVVPQVAQWIGERIMEVAA